MPKIRLIVTFILVSWRPGKLTVAPFFVILVLSFILVHVPNSSLPQAFAFPEAIHEESLEIASVLPVVATLSWRLAIGVFASIHVSIRKFLHAKTVLQRVFELTLVDSTSGYIEA